MRQASPFVLFVLMGISFFGTACSSTPSGGGDGTSEIKSVPNTGTAVTIVGWSLRNQAPVPVQGVLRQGGHEVAKFDTKARPDGTTVSVSPGPYEVQVTHRLAGEKAVPASGLERIDARMGETVRCEVVVDDREGGEAATENQR